MSLINGSIHHYNENAVISYQSAYYIANNISGNLDAPKLPKLYLFFDIFLIKIGNFLNLRKCLTIGKYYKRNIFIS